MGKLKLNEIVFIAIVGAGLGVFWFFYTSLYDILKPFLKPIMMENMLNGVWLMGAIFFPYIIRKPGSALLGEVTAAFVQGMIARWGIYSLIYGFGQGITVEIFFLILRYKRWNYLTISIGALISGVSSYFLAFYFEKWHLMSFNYNLVQFIAFSIGGIILGGLLSKWLADGLKKTGVLNQYEIAKSEWKA